MPKHSRRIYSITLLSCFFLVGDSAWSAKNNTEKAQVNLKDPNMSLHTNEEQMTASVGLSIPRTNTQENSNLEKLPVPTNSDTPTTEPQRPIAPASK